MWPPQMIGGSALSGLGFLFLSRKTDVDLLMLRHNEGFASFESWRRATAEESLSLQWTDVQ